MASPIAFAPASSLPRASSPTRFAPPAPPQSGATSASTGPSNRNASNAHLGMPVSAGESSTADGGEVGNAVAGPSAPRKPVNVPNASKRAIVVNACQRGNPLLKLISNVSWEYGDIVPDYVLGANTCCLFLSLRYHRLHPEYLHSRIEKLRGMYLGRILLILCDINEHQEPLREITKVCLINEMTVMVAWTNDEAALYLSTYKLFEHRPPDLLKERVNQDYASQLQNVLTGVRGVNKTDVMTLGTNFGSFKSLSAATPEQLSLCPGLGDVKVRRLHDAFHLPFKVTPTSRAKVKARAAEKLRVKAAKQKRDMERDGVLPPGQLTLVEMGAGAEGPGGTDAMNVDLDEVSEPPTGTGSVDRGTTAASAAEASPEWPEDLPSDDEGTVREKDTANKPWRDPLASDSDDEG